MGWHDSSMTWQSVLSSLILATLLGAAIALAGTFFAERSRTRSEERRVAREVAEQHEREGRELLEHLAVLDIHLNSVEAAGTARDEIPIEDELYTRLLVEIGALHRADCRAILQDGLYAIGGIGIVRQFGTLDFPLVHWQRRISRSMIRVASAVSRGDQPDEDAIATIEQASSGITEAWRQADDLF